MKRITKFFSVLVILLMLVDFVIAIPEKALAYQPIDQVNSNGLTNYWYIKIHQWEGQVFKPTKNRMDALGVAVSGNGSPATITLNLMDLTTVTSIANVSVAVGAGVQWIYFDFPTDLVINNPGSYYGAYLSTTSNNAYWLVDTTGTYANGYAIVDGSAELNQDFGFITYGYNFEAPPAEEPAAPPAIPPTPEAEATPAPDSQPAVTPSSDSTSSSIKPPTEVVGADVADDNGDQVKLNWKASATTDVTGYKILRSAEKNKGFASIGTIDKNTLEFTDKALTAGTKYFYYVRAYKDKVESANSNQVEVTPLDTVAPAQPKNFTRSSQGLTTAIFEWDQNEESDLAGYILRVYSKDADIEAESTKILESIDLDKGVLKYKLIFADHKNLVSDGDYDYYLVAKDNSGNLSEAAEAIAKESLVSDNSEITKAKMTTTELAIYIIGGLVLLALIVFLIIKLLKNRKKKKQLKGEPEKE